MRIYGSIEEYRACVESYYKQVQPYVRHAHLSDTSLFVTFISREIADTWMEPMERDLCLVIDYSGAEIERLSYSFFAGEERRTSWTTQSRHKIRRWFVERAPDVRLWGEKGRVKNGC